MRTSASRMPCTLSQVASWATFLSWVRPDRISSPITASAAVQTRSSLIQIPFVPSLSKDCPYWPRRKKRTVLRFGSGRTVGFGALPAYIPGMTQYITVTADDRVEARNGVIKLHGSEGFAGMRKAGRLAAEVLDALVPHVVPGVATQDLDDIVYRDFCGHGVGRLFHDSPEVIHAGRPGSGPELKPGMIFTVEPMINIGRPDVKVLEDGWTAVTRDRSLSAQFEHSIGITEDGCEVFTKSPRDLDKPPYV